MKNLVVLLGFACFLSSCGPHRARLSDKLPELKTAVPGQTVTVLALEDDMTLGLRREAQRLGIQVEGETILRLTGKADDLAQLPIGAEQTAILDEQLAQPSSPEPFQPDERALYMAKRDFGIVEYLKEHPEHDGRGVVVGQIDDGVAVNLEGFQKTSDGKRKVIARHRSTTLMDTPVVPIAELKNAPASVAKYAESVSAQEKSPAWLKAGWIDESRPVFGFNKWDGEGKGDPNADGKQTEIAVVAVKLGSEPTSPVRVCIDVNVDSVAQPTECFGTFEATGEYAFWDADKLAPITAEFDAEKNVVLLNGNESKSTHGEGVASVMAGHRIGGQFDGIAPGAQIADWTHQAPSHRVEESVLTVGAYLKAMEWLSSKGARIINMSLYTFARSAKARSFMRDAVEALQKKRGFIVTFAAGNDGPGLSTVYERGNFPDAALFVGAFVSRDLDESVHGVTGLPSPGRVVWYSSNGPSTDGGRGIHVISPLASLTQSNAEKGYMAFAGTSSAAPAIGGFAAVLVSAIQAQGLPFDGVALAHAIRRSATPLEGVPYIVQGFGLPKIKPAIEIYKSIVAGKTFADVEATVASSTGGSAGPDGTPAYGVFLRSSRLRGAFDRVVTLKGIPGSTLTKAQAGTILRPLKIEYSAPWFTGPSLLWLARGESSFNLHVDPSKADFSQLASTNRELTGEVTLRDAETGEKIAVVPVTIVDDQPIERGPITAQATLGAEEGRRIHFSVAHAGTAIRIRSRTQGGLKANLSVRVYDATAHMVLLSGKWGGPSDEVLYLAPAPGWYQVGIARDQGTTAPMDVVTTVEALPLSIASSIVADKLVLDYDTADEGSPLKIELKPAAQLLTETIATTAANDGKDGAGLVSMKFPVPGPGAYFFRPILDTKSELSYAAPISVTYLRNAQGKIVRNVMHWNFAEGGATSDFPFEVKAGEETGATLEYFYSPFERTETAGEAVTYRMQAWLQPPGGMIAQGNWDGSSGRSTVALSGALKSGSYDVWASPIGRGTGSVKLGTVVVQEPAAPTPAASPSPAPSVTSSAPSAAPSATPSATPST